ncbi:MAG: bifunctional heptose 7-phosphate kinase/heptose 1-phosphate adenyltransferase [Planctomycetia bacterium]|nr:bifunctional heptose 7-phosphate kinase/heptose 1-phosphate adenyltransferase [Planctomycetia bacterium]
MKTDTAVHDILDQIGRPHILVIGDLILDRYTFGNAERVSPEAPVVVLRVDSKEVRLGGAASVAMLLRGLEAEVTVAGVVGDDSEGRTLLSLLRDEKVNCDLVLVDPSRPTTTKERVIGRAANRHSHQIVRVDYESRDPLDNALEELLTGELDRLLRYAPDPRQACLAVGPSDLRTAFSAVLISDYAKGVCAPTLLRRLIDAVSNFQIPVIVDPARIADYSRYAGVRLLKPNRQEAELASGRSIASPQDALVVGQNLCRTNHVRAVVTTLDRDGMSLVQNDGAIDLFPCEARDVYDITGAGDMVLATLGVCLGSGMPLTDSVRIANVAAGLQVERFGVAAISRAELARALQKLTLRRGEDPREGGAIRTRIPNSVCKLISLSEAVALAATYRAQGMKIVFTNGCFDLLHVGHVSCLEQAAALGDVLFVAVNSDATVRSLKGHDRPIITEHDRAKMLASLACVAHVLIFDDPSPHALLENIRPDILAKGGTTTEIVGREVVEVYGGQIVRLSEVPGVSTTALLTSRRINAKPPAIAFRDHIDDMPASIAETASPFISFE